MSIVQISRISHRKGVNENLPQLAVGEIGWSVDTRQIYIGNGGSDAPTIENIEILTEHSNIGISSYTYYDEVIGYTAVTGASINSPTTRTLQAKLDDFVSVRDYGAKGDGATDDTVAINRALTDLFVTQTFQATRRTLYFPAGTYIISSEIKIPAHATLVGEGTKSSIIKTNTSQTSVVRTVDSKNQSGADIGTSSAIVPSNISVIRMGFETSIDNDILLVDQANNVLFDNCTFIGNKTSLPSSVASSKACVRIESIGMKTSNNIKFNNCIFQNHTYGVQIDDEVYNIVFNSCRYENLYKGSVIGFEDSTTTPKSVKFIGSYFNNIYDRAVHVYDGLVSTAFNHFNEVGTGGDGISSPISPIIDFEVDDCYSIGDTFERNDTDDSSYPRIKTNGYGSFGMDSKRIQYGRYQRESGNLITLTDNTSSATSTGLTFSDSIEPYIEIEYSIVRGSNVRNGILRITHDSGNQAITEEYDENNSTVGVTFGLLNSSGSTILTYTTTSTGTNASFKYTMRKLV